MIKLKAKLKDVVFLSTEHDNKISAEDRYVLNSVQKAEDPDGEMMMTLKFSEPWNLGAGKIDVRFFSVSASVNEEKEK